MKKTSFTLPTENDPVFIIAEIGKNFIETEDERPQEEYLENAKELIRLAYESGADAVKFQTHEVEDEQLPVHIVAPHFKGADRHAWVTRNTKITPTSFFKELKEYAEQLGIIFFSTPMSRKAAEKLDSLGMPLWKIGSGDIHDHVLLDFVAKTGLPSIISTGMTSVEELDRTVSYLQDNKISTAVLYCVSQYPAPKEAFNLSTITRFKNRYPHATIGFSDHSHGNEVALVAVKLGARIIEKHFSRDRELWGSDHKTSLIPEEFADMVRLIRAGEYQDVDATPYLGDTKRELEGATSEFRPYFNKTLVAGHDLPKGHVITMDDIYAMRPRMAGGEFDSHQTDELIGKKLSSALKKYDAFATTHLRQ